MTHKELYSICHDEAVAYANLEQWSKRNAEQKACLIQGYLDAMMKMRKSEITEKKKEYPKTYCECKDILGLWDIDDTERGYYKTDLIDKLQMLLICRDAYWKIAGEEMGLGKPWEPDYDYSSPPKYIISCYFGDIIKEKYCGQYNRLLSFPIEEMRDAFFENFKELIEQCKELL